VAATKASEARLNRHQGIARDSVLNVEDRRYADHAGGKRNRGPEQAQPERRNRRSTGKTITCYYCQTKGHRCRQCRKLKSDREEAIHVDRSNSPMPALVSATDTLSCSVCMEFSSASASTGQGRLVITGHQCSCVPTPGATVSGTHLITPYTSRPSVRPDPVEFSTEPPKEDWPASVQRVRQPAVSTGAR